MKAGVPAPPPVALHCRGVGLWQHWLLSSQAVPAVLQAHVGGAVPVSHPLQHCAAVSAVLHVPRVLLQQKFGLPVPNRFPQTLPSQQAFGDGAPCAQGLPGVTQIGLGGDGKGVA